MKHTKTLTMSATTTAASFAAAKPYSRNQMLMIQAKDGDIYVGNEDAQEFLVRSGGALRYPCEATENCFVKSASGTVNVVALVFE